MSEFDRLQELISDLSKNTIKSYTSLYNSLFTLLGNKEINKSKESEIIQDIEILSNKNPSTKWSFINIPIMIFKLYGKNSKKLIEYREKVFIEKKEFLQNKNKEMAIDFPPLDELKEYLEELYNNEEWEKYVLNYLLINYGVRNKDVDVFITDNSAIPDEDKNLLIVRGFSVDWVRNIYKTAKTYGQKVIKIKDEKFLDAVRKLPNNSWLLNNKGNHISESAVGKHIVRRTYMGLSEADIFKILVKDITTKGKNVLSNLNELSNYRGSSLVTIKDSYDLDAK
jgi:hypothetical protein